MAKQTLKNGTQTPDQTKGQLKNMVLSAGPKVMEVIIEARLTTAAGIAEKEFDSHENVTRIKDAKANAGERYTKLGKKDSDCPTNLYGQLNAIQAKMDRRETLNQEIIELRTSLEGVPENASTITAKITDLESQKSEKQVRLEGVKNKLKTKLDNDEEGSEVDNLNTRRKDLLAEIREIEGQIARSYVDIEDVEKQIQNAQPSRDRLAALISEEGQLIRGKDLPIEKEQKQVEIDGILKEIADFDKEIKALEDEMASAEFLEGIKNRAIAQVLKDAEDEAQGVAALLATVRELQTRFAELEATFRASQSQPAPATVAQVTSPTIDMDRLVEGVVARLQAQGVVITQAEQPQQEATRVVAQPKAQEQETTPPRAISPVSPEVAQEAIRSLSQQLLVAVPAPLTPAPAEVLQLAPGEETNLDRHLGLSPSVDAMGLLATAQGNMENETGKQALLDFVTAVDAETIDLDSLPPEAADQLNQMAGSSGRVGKVAEKICKALFEDGVEPGKLSSSIR
ncbi:MAG: hypothetical protein ABII22_03520 [Candidatus Micrarchaeota archaeon]